MLSAQELATLRMSAEGWVVSGDVTAATDTLKAAVASKTHYITDIILSAEADGEVEINDGTTNYLEKVCLLAGTAIAIHPHVFLRTAANKKIDLIGTNGKVYYTVCGFTN